MGREVFGLNVFEQRVHALDRQSQVPEYRSPQAIDAMADLHQALHRFIFAVCEERLDLEEAVKQEREAAKTQATPAQLAQWSKDAEAMRALAGALDRHPPVKARAASRG